MARRQIFHPHYCKKCGGRLARYAYMGDGHGTHEPEALYHCSCQSIKNQLLARESQEKAARADGWTERRYVIDQALRILKKAC